MQTDPEYRPSNAQETTDGGAAVPPFSGSDLVLSPSQWSSHIVGASSSSILGRNLVGPALRFVLRNGNNRAKEIRFSFRRKGLLS